MPGQTADTPRWTGAQHARCFTQLPTPRNSHQEGAQPGQPNGGASEGELPGVTAPGHSHHLGTILVKSFPPGSHQGFHVRKPQESPRQSPAWPLRPSAPLRCQVQTHSALGPSAVLTKPAAGTMPPSVQTRNCNSKNSTDDQLPKEPAPCTPTHPQCPGPHFPWSAEAWASPRRAEG